MLLSFPKCQSTIQGIQFQLLQAPPHIIHYSGDLKCGIFKKHLVFYYVEKTVFNSQYTVMLLGFFLILSPLFFVGSTAIADYGISLGVKKSLVEFQAQLSHRKVWMASSIHKGEEEGNWWYIELFLGCPCHSVMFLTN